MYDFNGLTGLLPSNFINELTEPLEKRMKQLRIYYKLSHRIKGKVSVEKKYNEKAKDNNGYKLQDYLGCRFIFYFRDDIDLCRKFIEKMYDIDNVSEEKNEDVKQFKPERINYVCKIPQKELEELDSRLFRDFPIESTFEIQLRTIFSDGWLEVEHDLHYKERDNKESSWNKYSDLTRVLFGLNATLQNCDWTMLSLLDRMAYRNYKNGEWEYMIKNKFHLQIANDKLTEKIVEEFNLNNDIAKSVFRSDRVSVLSQYPKNLPLTTSNLVYVSLLVEKIESNIDIPELMTKEFYRQKQ